MRLCEKLKKAREEATLTQEQAARALEVTREVISQWESEKRVPGLRYLEQMAILYRAGYLLGEDVGDTNLEDRNKLLSELSCNNDDANTEVGRWLQFLDRWADFQSQFGKTPGRGKPPKNLNRGAVFSDSRHASKEAAKVRDEFRLGQDALPNLFAFLDELQILVYKANLGRWSSHSKEGISGAFYNHPALGFCIIVNAQTTLGRQAFTLAHELAHAFYHCSLRTIVSRAGIRNPIEAFADAFASHFLVPTKTLNTLIDEYGWKGKFDAYKVIQLASSFQVSWLFMLYRLYNEKHISIEEQREWLSLSPTLLAKNMGVSDHLFVSQVEKVEGLARFPASVLSKVRESVQKQDLDCEQAADLLGIDLDAAEFYTILFPQPQANAEEKEAWAEFDLAGVI